MPYAIRLPDGTLVKNIPDDLPPEEAKRRIIAAGLVKAPESTIMGEIVRGGKQLASSVRTGLGSLTAPEEAALAGLERGEKIAAEAGEGPSFAAVRKAYEERGLLPAAGEVASQIPRAVAGQLPQLAAMAGGARLGAMAGAGIGSVVPVVGTGAGALVGGVLGAGATLLPQFMGTNVERQAKERLERGEPISIDRTKAYGAAAGQAAVESAGTAFVLGKRVVKGVLGITDDAALTTAKAGKALEETAKRSLATSAGRGALRGTAEIPVEIAQAVIERAQAGLDLTSPEAMEEYGENAYLAGLVGPTIGSAANVVERRGAQRALAATAPPVEAPIERAERLKAEKAAAETPPPAPPVTEPAPPPVVETPAPPPVAETPAPPPVAETPAPPVEEPKVRKAGEPAPLPDVLDAPTIAKIGFTRGSIHNMLVGKSVTDPEVREVLQTYLDAKREEGTLNPKTEAKINAFLARLPEPAAPPAAPAAPPVAVPPTTETPSADATQPEAGGAGAPVAGEPGAGAAPGGAGVTEPSGVVPPVADAQQPAGGEGQQPAPVTPPAPAPAPAAEAPPPAPAPAPTPAQVEQELTALVESGRITEEQASAYREELLGEAEEAPQTAMGQAFQKQVDSLKAQMDALRQKSGKKPAPKSKNRAKFDELQAKLDAITVTESGDLVTRIEKAGLKGVVGMVDGRPVIDIAAVKDNLIKARAVPEMLDAILTYIGVDRDGHYLDTVYTSDDAAEKHGMSRKSGSNVRRAAEALGVDTEVRNRFLASQSELGVGAAKNASEEGTGATDLKPRRGALYESKKKGMPKVIAFLRGALTPDGKLDFSESRVPLESAKAKGDKKAVVGLAEMFVRASQFNRNNYKNDEVINALQAEIDKRIKSDRKKVNDAITRAYGKFTETEDVSSNQKALELQIEEDLKSGKLTPVGDIADLKAPQLAALITEGKAEIDEKLGTIKPVQKEAAAPDQTLTEEEAAEAELRAEETEVEDRTARLSDEDVAELPARPTPGTASPAITKAVAAGNTTRALQAIRETPDATPLDHLVAQRYLGLGKFLGLPKIEVRPAAQVKGSAQYDPETDTVSIAEGQEDSHTVLHEVTHGFVHKLIRANEQGLRNDEGYRDLVRLFKFLTDNHPKLAGEYGMSSLTEFASEAMSNPQFQKKLGTIEYKARSAWSTFVDSVRKLLKLPAGKSSALAEAMAGVDSLLRVGREYQTKGPATGAEVASLTAQTEAAVKGIDVIGEQKEARPMSGNPAIKARTRVANNMAGLFDKFNEWYGGAIRTSGNRLIPSIFLSRALDADRISNEAQLVGGLQKVNELIVAGEIRDANGNQVLGVDGKPLSYANVLKRIADAAKKEGKSYEQYKSVIDKVLYGHREFNIRENNRIIEQQAAALEAIGKKDEAKKLWEDIAVLAIKDNAKLDQIEAEFQNSEFIKGVSSDFDAIRFNFIDMLVETGRISKEVAQEWKDNNGYIPFNRTQDYEEAFDAEGSRVRGVGVTRNIKKFKGSTRQSTSVIDNFSKLLDWATGEAMRNEAKNRALKDMVLMGAAKPRNGKTLASDEPGGVVKTFEDGVAQEYIVPDPMLFVGFTMHTPEMNKVIQAFNRYGTRVLRAGVTMMPPFAIKQVFDDITRAYTFAGVKDNVTLTKNILTNFPKNWLNEILNKEVWKTAAGQTSVKELRRLGIVASFDLSREGNLKNIEVEAGAKGETLWNKVLRIMEAGAKASDVSVRQAIYDQVLKETKDQVQAESAAREIINFSYQGAESTVRNIASVVPFFNAYAQGTDKLAVAAAGKVVGMTPGAARSMFYTRMTVLTALGFAYALMMQDDEEYNKLPDHVRDTNWIIPGAKIAGMPVGIPVPQDLAFFFKAIPERVVRYYKYQGTEEERAAVEVLSQLAARGYDVFSPPNVTPQLIRPLFENLVNYSFFLGRPLESQAQIQQLRPFERYGVGTSDSMKIVARWLENLANATGIDAFAVSPIKLENAMRGLLGTTGGTALAVVDMMVNPSRTDRPLHQQLSTQLTGASAVLKNSVGTAFMDEIYNLEKRVEQVNGTYNRLIKTQPEKVEEYLKDNIGMYSIREPVKSIMDAIRTLNETAMTIDRDTSLSPEERRKLIDELRVEQNEIARVVFSLRKQARDIQAGL